MPDWKKLVREQMITLNLPPGVKEEVIAELAIHLEELYQHAQSNGTPTERLLRSLSNKFKIGGF